MYKNDEEKWIMIISFMEICIYIWTTVLLADLIRRFCRCVYEYIFYSKRYSEDRLWSIFNRAFTYNCRTKVLNVVFFLMFFVRFVLKPTFLWISYHYLLYMPFFWIFNYVDYTHSVLSYADTIRSQTGLDYGSGMALNYFYGYLKLTMPSHTGNSGIRERIEKYAAIHKVEFATNRLVILIPHNLYTAQKIESKILEKVAPLDTVILNRAGVKRPYKNDVYKLKSPINDKYYYIAVEGATPLLSFYEAIREEGAYTWLMNDMKREILFQFYHNLKKLINNCHETQEEIELVFYNAHTGHGNKQDVGEVLKAHFEYRLSEKKYL